MPALSAPDEALWSSHPYDAIPYLWVDRPQTVFAALVNQSVFTFPLYELTFDGVTTGAFGDNQEGMTVLLGSTAGAYDLGITYVRKAATSTVLYIGESSQGAAVGELSPADNVFITVLKDYRVWAIAARFDQNTSIQYKKYDLAVDAGGRNYSTDPGPIANGGCARAAIVDDGTGLATFDFSAADSIPMTEGSTIASYLWGVDGGTITVGTTTTSAITATFAVGRYMVSLRVQDSNGHQHTTHILVVALDLDDATYKPILDFDIIERRHVADGSVMSFIIHEDMTEATYLPGAAVIFFELESYGATEGSLAGPATCEQVKFNGWLDTSRESPESTFQGIQRGVEFRCISSAERLRQIPLLPQLIKYKGSGADEWDELEGLTPTRVLLYLLLWHSTVPLCCPVVIDSLDSAIKRYATTAGELYGQCVEVARSRAKQFTCDQRGIFRLVSNQLIIETGSRTPTVIVSIDGDDYSAVDLERNHAPRTYWVDGRGITLGTAESAIKPLFSLAPGNAPGQGASRQELAGLIVASQTQLNAWTGNERARINSVWQPVKLTMTQTGDAGIEPALGEWIRLTVLSSTNRRGLSLTTQRCLPVEVSVSYSNDYTRTKEVELTVLVETSGTPGVTIIRQENELGLEVYPPSYEVYPIETWIVPPGGAGSFELYKGTTTIAALEFAGNLWITNDFESASPSWTSYALGLSGDCVAACVDAYSPLYLGTGSTVNIWIATSQRIYKVADIFGARTVTSQKTFAQATPTRSIEFSWGENGFGMCASYYGRDYGQLGTQITYTIDGGATWSAEVNINGHWADAGAYFWFTPGLHVSSKVAGKAYVRAFTQTNVNNATGDGYVTVDHGATWSLISNPDLTLLGNGAGLYVPWDSNPNERVVYSSSWRIVPATSKQYSRLYRIEADGVTQTEITPIYDSREYGPLYPWGLYAAPSNRQIVILAGDNGQDPALSNNDLGVVWLSINGGTTWTRLTDPESSATKITHAVTSGDPSSVIYLWGYACNIRYSQNGGVTIENKKGNMTGSTRLIRIFGG